MPVGIEALTVPALSAALDAAVMRQQVHASNIANAHTVGYVPQRLGFAAEWTRAWPSGDAASREPMSPRAELSLRVQSEAAAAPGERSDKVQLDREVAALAQNSMHYQLLIRGLNRHFSILGSAVADGKRCALESPRKESSR